MLSRKKATIISNSVLFSVQGKTFCISNDYNVYIIGAINNNNSTDNNKDNILCKPIQNLTNIKMIDCGVDHSIFLDFDGNVYGMGKNTRYQLGLSELNYFDVPLKIDIPEMKYISCGHNFTICLSINGYLYSFGDNYDGQLGLGDSKTKSSPKLISDLTDVEYLSCGGFHVVCFAGNNFYSWGFNSNGQLGQNNTVSRNNPTLCNNWPANIIDIKCSRLATCLLTLDGSLYICGNNTNGILGLNITTVAEITIPTKIDDIPEIQRFESGIDHYFCIDYENNLWVFGNNSNAQLGLGDLERRSKPVKNIFLHDIIDISSGGYSTFVKTSNNKIYGFGANKTTQLGITTNEKQLKPIQVLKGKEDIWCSFTGKSRAKSARK